MTKIRSNFLEIILKEIFTGKIIYNDNGEKIIISDINYQPILQEVYIKDENNNGYKLSLNLNYEFDLNLNNLERIKPNKGKIKSKNKI
jgi:hypothetical protein